MHEFHLPDMTCGHCASKVNVTLKRVDPSCEIQVDLPRRLVSVKSGEDREALVEALADAGYSPL
ncbi:heavy-metal-associated domain-containing protein [Hydrogenophaga sp.]|uniref:heavy-metal-associated domain-containing protein n=1 Tax=Hydrogenophaga sp. TaxID=1904254 RepID=UPI0025B9497C|nr:heavy-metal-associated domain-containing protein [Hydrogenophaga sp.]MBT9463455.1 heavy-metal-associated domain-containing protein [Hydrogenophaga sp.]